MFESNSLTFDSSIFSSQNSFLINQSDLILKDPPIFPKPTFPPLGLPDLQVTISTFDSAISGSELYPIKVTIKNTGTTTAWGTKSAGSKGYMIDVMLSSDTTVPAGFATYSPSYAEDVLLAGGRISNTPDLAPGDEFVFIDSAGLPASIPAGSYYLAAQIDAGQVVAEANEKNNTAFSLLKISDPKPLPFKAPDLVVTSLETTGNAMITDDGFTLPIEVTVKNEGDGPADLFKVAVEFSKVGSNQSFVVAFNANETAEINPDLGWYPFTKNSLQAGNEITFTGHLTFADEGLLNQPISLVATADSIADDEFIPEYGRVLESDETNNVTEPIPVTPYFGSDAVIKMSEIPGFKLLDKPLKVAEGIWFLGDGPSPDQLRLLLPTNLNAADTTNSDQLWSGGDLGLDLTGNNLTVGVWEALENGNWQIRETHQELSGRVAIPDSSAGGFSNHATHVAGTIGAAGINSSARGMANAVNIRSYSAQDEVAEMAADAALMVASNHSYGAIAGWSFGLDWGIGNVDSWMEDRSLFSTEDSTFGKYNTDAQKLDQVLFDNPELLSVWSAGNDRNNTFINFRGDNSYVTYFSTPPMSSMPVGSGYYLVSSSVLAAPPADGNAGVGFDSLPPDQVAKNSLVVGAINDITIDPYNNSNVQMSFFSSWGPTDDGRVKPDVVANGVDLISAVAGSDSSYDTSSGTSMAAPNVTGTVALLVEHFKNNFLETPRSATTKGLLIHTAFDAGNIGPDYRHGWGVVDAAAAAQFITNISNPTSSDLLVQNTYHATEETIQVTSNGTDPIKATLVWTDPAGPIQNNDLDNSTPVLVNDLDLWITGPDGTIHNPWTLDPANPNAPAVRITRNHLDNVEQVLIDAPTPGEYTIHIGQTGDALEQDYSLLVSGANSNEMVVDVVIPDLRANPDHVGGDTDFDGNGPDINAVTSLKRSGSVLWVELETTFTETKDDRTTFSNQGTPAIGLFFDAQERYPGWEIEEVIVANNVDVLNETDSDHNVNRYERTGLVNYYDIQGDTDGGPFGGDDDPWALVNFNPIQVRLKRV